MLETATPAVDTSGRPFARLLRSLGETADARWRAFERVCQWFLENAPEYRSQLGRVWLWDDWPGRWGADAGIDLVAETREGQLWAIQAKAYDPSYTIRKTDVDTFLSESARPEFAYRLLIATTDRIGSRARRTLAAQEKPAHLILRSQLEAAQVEWPESAELRPTAPARKAPFAHNDEAVAAVCHRLAEHERGQLLMACGTGKTLVALWVNERLRAQRTLVLVPSLSLLSQTLREWTANATQPFQYLAVCSDDTVVGDDAMVATTAELGFQ